MTVYILVALVLVHLAVLGLLFKYRPDVYLEVFNGNDLCIFRTYSLTWCKKKLLPLKEDFAFAYNCEGTDATVQRGTPSVWYLMERIWCGHLTGIPRRRRDMRLPTFSSAARRILEIVDSYPEERLLGLLQTETIETPSLQGRNH